MDIDQPERPSPPSTAYGSPSYSPPELEQCTDQREEVKTNYHEAEKEEEDDDDDEERKACRKAKGKMRASSPEEDDDSDDEEQRAARRKAKGKMKASSPPESDEADDEQEKAARRKAKGKGRAYPPTDENYNDDYDDENRPPEPPFAVSLNPLTSHPTPAAAAQEDASMMDTPDYKASYGYGDERHFGDADAAMNETLSPPSSPYSEDDENNNNNNENDTFTPSASRNRLSERRGHAGLAPLDAQSFPAMMQGDGGRGRGRGRGRGQGWGLAWRETVTEETVERGGWRVYEDPPPSPSMQFVSEEEDEEVVGMEDEEMGWEVYDASLWEMAAERAQEQEAGMVTLKVPVPMPSSSSSSSVTRGGGEASGSSSTKSTSSSATTVNYELLAMHNSGSSSGGRGGDEYVRAVRSYKAILTGNFLSYEKDEVMKVIYHDVDGRYFTLLPLKERASTGRAHTRNFVPTDAAAAGDVTGYGGDGRSGVRGERKGG